MSAAQQIIAKALDVRNERRDPFKQVKNPKRTMTLWVLDDSEIVVLEETPDGRIRLSNFPDCHRFETFGCADSLAFYLGTDVEE